MTGVLVNAATRGIGNAIMLTPLIEIAARRQGGPVDILVEDSPAAQVFLHNPHVRETIVYNRSQRGAFLRKHFRRYRTIVSPDPALISLFLRLLAPAELRTITALKLPGLTGMRGDFSWSGTHVYRVHDDEHEALAHARTLDPSLSGATLPAPAIYLTSQEREAGRRLLRACVPEETARVLAFHVGSGPQAWKRFPADRFATIARETLARDPHAHVVCLGGPEERVGMEQLASRAGGGRVHVLSPGLREAFAVLAQVDVFLGNDSGLGHAAAALGTPSVILFGPTNPRRTRPIGPVTALMVELPCRPCYNKEGSLYRPDECPFSYRCFGELSDEVILAALHDARR